MLRIFSLSILFCWEIDFFSIEVVSKYRGEATDFTSYFLVLVVIAERMDSMGNAFIACGVIYCIDSYHSNLTTINFAYDTKTGNQWNPSIQFTNQYGYNSMVDYNPKEKVLYAWDSHNQLTYSLTWNWIIFYW